ncbi:hypothetical protein ACHAXA_008034 [Cyclostephanos tholiformis]|uniref:Uncharacterized protein n=1 Tax=Cyclostephanos tholiformis TaxID=382380 RepID=A0ABD3RFD1_9STRA
MRSATSSSTASGGDGPRSRPLSPSSHSPSLTPLIESFRSELPSPCTVHLSGKRTSRPPSSSSSYRAMDCRHRGRNIATTFATERHMIALVDRRSDVADDEGSGGGSRYYHLSVASMPSSSTSVVRDGGNRVSVAASKTNVYEDDGGDVVPHRRDSHRRKRCLAHSSIFWEHEGGMMGVEAFATTDDDDHDDDRDDDHDVATIRGTGQSTSDATSSMAVAAVPSAIDVGDDGMITKDGENVTNLGLSTPPAKYRLMTREIATICGEDFAPSGISLDSAPTVVHIAELHVAVDDNDNDNDDIRMANCAPTAIGIFVAFIGDDAPLRLYVVMKESLQRARRERCAVGEVGRDNDDDDGARFVLASLDDADLVHGRGHDDNDDDDEENDKTMCEPLVFSSPILAMDTIATDETPHPMRAPDDDRVLSNGPGTGHDAKMNRLAISCYDGTVRILTCRLKWRRRRRRRSDDDEDRRHDASPPRLCIQQCSSFIVDGPVISLHFGMTSSTIASLGEEISPADGEYRHPSLFLVAGSLCGFACLFYESTFFSSTLSWGGSHVESVRRFDGPLTVVDGLYDAQRSGREDCVTSVHVSCNHHRVEGGLRGRITIVVGTQGGRVLLFRQREEGGDDLVRIRDEIVASQRDRCDLARRIDQTREQISVLQDEKDAMGIKARELNAVISDVQSKVDFLKNASTMGTITKANTGDVTNGRQYESEHVAYVDESPLNVVDDEGRESTDNNDHSGTLSSDEMLGLETELKAARTELSSLQLSMYTHSCKIAELSSTEDELVCNLGEKDEEIARRREDLQHPRLLRKFHRYEISCERHLPYPIHGIASYEHRNQAGGGLDIFVSTRRSFHVFRHHYSSECVAAVWRGT